MTRTRFLTAAATSAVGLPLAGSALAKTATAAPAPKSASAAASQADTPNPVVPDPTIPARVVRAAEGTPFAVLGTQMVHKLTGADTYGQMMWLEDHNPPGAQIPPHVHTREDEVFRVLAGEVEFVIGENAPVRLGPGDIAFAPRYIPHSWRVTGDAPARTIMAAYPAGIEHMFAELSALPAGPPDLARVGEICGRYGISFV